LKKNMTDGSGKDLEKNAILTSMHRETPRPDEHGEKKKKKAPKPQVCRCPPAWQGERHGKLFKVKKKKEKYL